MKKYTKRKFREGFELHVQSGKARPRLKATPSPHMHDYTELTIITEGRGEHVVNADTSYIVEKGDVFVINRGDNHDVLNLSDLAAYNIQFSLSDLELPIGRLRQIPGFQMLFTVEPNLRHSHEFKSCLKISSKSLLFLQSLISTMVVEQREKTAGYESNMIASLIQILVFLSREYNTPRYTDKFSSFRIANVLSYMESHYTESLDLDSLAGKANMSKSTLLRVFRKTTGTTPVDYLIKLRVSKAIELLRTTDRNVTQIAFDVGFNDSNYFARQFKKITGTTPKTQAVNTIPIASAAPTQ